MTWVLIVGLTWCVLSLGLATLVGLTVRRADEQATTVSLADEVDEFLREEAARARLPFATPRSEPPGV